jgi:hypothetical protein
MPRHDLGTNGAPGSHSRAEAVAREAAGEAIWHTFRAHAVQPVDGIACQVDCTSTRCRIEVS